jgi:hypothetical protein
MFYIFNGCKVSLMICKISKRVAEIMFKNVIWHIVMLCIYLIDVNWFTEQRTKFITLNGRHRLTEKVIHISFELLKHFPLRWISKGF